MDGSERESRYSDVAAPLGKMPRNHPMHMDSRLRRWIFWAGAAAALVASIAAGRMADASPPSSSAARFASLEATTSDAARRDALRSIPLEKLSEVHRPKVESVLAGASLFRRLPIRVVDCDPVLYLFLVRHPDVVVNIWEVFKASRLELRQTGEGRFRVSEPGGADSSFEFVYQSHDTHVVYGEGVYQGPLLARPVKGRGVLVLKSGYVQETNNRHYITNRMDCFLSIEPGGVELAAKTVSPLFGKTVDNNFIQTLSFVGSLSHTAEVNSRGVQRLALQLKHVAPETRIRFAELAADIPEKYRAAADTSAGEHAKMAARPADTK